MAQRYLAEQTTVQEFFKILLNNTFPGDLRSPKIVSVMSHLLNLSDYQARKAIQELEKRELIEVVRSGIEILRVEPLDRNWTKAPKIPL